MGEDFSYEEEFLKVDLEELKQEILKLIDQLAKTKNLKGRKLKFIH